MTLRLVVTGIALAIAFVGIVGTCYGIVQLWRRNRSTDAERKQQALANVNSEHR